MGLSKSIITISAAFIPAIVLLAQSVGGEKASKPIESEMPRSKVEWGALNPARGKKGPRAANLWGDRTESSATGFLVKFVDGFSSPPHIHNVTYRGVVISGRVHNDDPQAEPMWMPPGSFWTQPAGEVHITSTKGEEVVAYIEIDEGPYLVLPKEKAFDRGERPVNVDASNIVWLDSSTSRWIEGGATNGPKISYLWGDPESDEPSGSMLKLPAGFTGMLTGDDIVLRVIVIRGGLISAGKTLGPGSYLGVEGSESRQVVTTGAEETIVYIRSSGRFQMKETAGEDR